MPAPQGILTEPPIVLLTLDYAGQTFRLATEAVSITDASGVPHLYAGGLPALEVGHSISLFGISETVSINIECILGADIPTLVSENHILTQAVAEIALYRRGDTYEKRYVCIKGRVQDPKLTEQGTVSFTVVMDAGEDVNVFPDPAWSLSSDTFYQGENIAFGETDTGKVYPVVFGSPGVVNTPTGDADVPATPAYTLPGFVCAYNPPPVWPGGGRGRAARGSTIPLLGNCILISYGWVWPTTVHVFDATDRTDAAGEPVYWTFDDNNNRISVVDLDTLSADWADPSLGPVNTYYVAWPTGSLFDNEASAFTSAGDVLEWALGLTSLPVDWARTGVARIYLNNIEVGGYWDQPCAPWEWIAQNLIPILPVSFYVGPDGIYPIVWRHWATASDAVFQFVDGLNCRIEVDIEEEGSDTTAGAFKLEYAYNMRSNRYMRTATWKAGDITTNHQSGSAYLGSSNLTEYARDHIESKQTDCIYSDNGANSVLAWQVCAYAHPRRVVHLVSDGLGCGFLEHGDVVTITSSDRHLSGEVAHVRRAVWRGSQFLVDAVIFWRPSP